MNPKKKKKKTVNLTMGLEGLEKRAVSCVFAGWSFNGAGGIRKEGSLLRFCWMEFQWGWRDEGRWAAAGPLLMVDVRQPLVGWRRMGSCWTSADGGCAAASGGLKKGKKQLLGWSGDGEQPAGRLKKDGSSRWLPMLMGWRRCRNRWRWIVFTLNGLPCENKKKQQIKFPSFLSINSPPFLKTFSPLKKKTQPPFMRFCYLFWKIFKLKLQCCRFQKGRTLCFSKKLCFIYLSFR